MDIEILAYVQSLAFIGLFVVFIYLAKIIFNIITPYSTFNELIERQNTAVAIPVAGFILAIAFIFIAVYSGPSSGFKNDVIDVSAYCLLGLGLLVLSKFINDKFLLFSFCNTEQIVVHKRVSVGIVKAASFIVSGLIIAGAMSGQGTLLSGIVFYCLGQLALIIFSRIYDAITSFDLLPELEHGNTAAAISFAATKIGLGIILLHGLLGSFVSWQDSLIMFAIDAGLAFCILPTLRILIDKILFISININDAIKHENTAIATIEAMITIVVALAILFII